MASVDDFSANRICNPSGNCKPGVLTIFPPLIGFHLRVFVQENQLKFVVNIFWDLKHNNKFLVELVSWQDNMTRGHESEHQSPLTKNEILSDKFEEGLCFLHTSSQKDLVWGDVLEYTTYTGASTISISFSYLIRW